MDKPKKSSFLIQVPTVLLFILIALSALIIFGYFTYVLMSGIFTGSDLIIFNKGAMYMLGVGLTSGLLSFFMLYEIFNKEVSASLNKKSTRPALIFVCSKFVIPQLAGFAVNEYIKSIEYVYCAEESSHWLQNQNLIYANNELTCTKHIK